MDNKQPGSLEPYGGNIFQIFGNRIRLIFHLMADPRVAWWLKLLPIGSIAYAIWPVDIPGPIDDAALLAFASYMFVELCPPDVVEEHEKRLRIASGGQPTVAQQPPSEENVVDTEFHEVKKE
jgi:hypothetical protein